MSLEVEGVFIGLNYVYKINTNKFLCSLRIRLGEIYIETMSGTA